MEGRGGGRTKKNQSETKVRIKTKGIDAVVSALHENQTKLRVQWKTLVEKME